MFLSPRYTIRAAAKARRFLDIKMEESSERSVVKIEVVPMPQRIEAKDIKEDWTGKSSTALRRKLQNRLNKRASRKPPLRHAMCQTSRFTGKRRAQGQERPTPAEKAYEAAEDASLEFMLSLPKHIPDICSAPYIRRALVSATDFTTFFNTPLPSDHKLLTLLHFNLVRALTQNVLLLCLDPDRMHEDIDSPFLSDEGRRLARILPPTLQPTTLQQLVPHHAEIDAFPCPGFRDNLLMAGGAIDGDELCVDMLYGVEDEWSEEAVGGRTGLIVWSDPWLEGSWEVEEGFARKYGAMLVGCRGLIESTNYWRRSRGEAPLLLE